MSHCHNYEEVKKIAESYGYTVEDKVECGVTWYAAFLKGTRRIWRTREGFQTADLVDDLYSNHKPFTKFEDALMRPVTLSEVL